MELSNNAASALQLLRKATWLDDDLDIQFACKELAEWLELN